MLETKGTDSSKWLVSDLDAVLSWYGVEILGKLGKAELKNGQAYRNKMVYRISVLS